jgi:PAS domain S-box-containing protein
MEERSAVPSRPEIFRLIVEAAPFAILIADDEGRYVEANPAACELFGQTREQLVGRRILDFVDPGDIAPTRDRWTSFREDHRQIGEFPLARPDGAHRILRYHAVADFAPGLHLSFLEDVTDERQALALSEARFRSLADGLNLVIWIGDAEGRSQFFNRHWFDYTGLAPVPEGSPELDRWVEAIHPADAARAAETLAERRARGEEVEITFRLRRHDGAYRWHLARSIAIRDQAGRILRRLGSATDIEDQRQAIENLQLERDLRERFVAALSHDLRSPLGTIKMAADLLLRRPGEAQHTETLARRISRNVGQADRLIQSLLDVTRISAGEPLAIHRAPCDLAALVREVVADQAALHGDRFTVEAPAELRASVDELGIRRTLENLLGNAVKYGDRRLPVRVRVTEQGGEIRLAVHNQGEPIPAEEQARIFQPYHRARAGAGKGWGLGLTLVRAMAEAHGGGVQVASSPEAGTTFTVTLRRD